MRVNNVEIHEMAIDTNISQSPQAQQTNAKLENINTRNIIRNGCEYPQSPKFENESVFEAMMIQNNNTCNANTAAAIMFTIFV